MSDPYLPHLVDSRLAEARDRLRQNRQPRGFRTRWRALAVARRTR